MSDNVYNHQQQRVSVELTVFSKYFPQSFGFVKYQNKMICTSESVQTPRLCFQVIMIKIVVIFWKSGGQGVVHTDLINTVGCTDSYA